MSFPAKVYRILIGSPSDVAEERSAIPMALTEWNVKNSFEKKTVFLPTKWETNTAPIMGGRPQEIINKQIVIGSDILIAIFGIRLGSPTGEAKSGTVEEIQTFMQMGKPVMVYFSNKPIPPDQFQKNAKQFSELCDFKEECKKNGLIEHYDSIDDLKKKIIDHLSLMVGQFEESDIPPPREKPTTASEEKASHTAPGDFIVAPVIVDYSEKAILVKGNTVPYKEKFIESGGKWNSSLKGWIFSKKKTEEVKEILGMAK
ncbi:MAG: hypothetical protein REI12_03155 [Pedobacter sp.]|nr:hypothetical protein [Pedobacter sp.]